MTRQCIKGRRIESAEFLSQQTQAWCSNSNEKQRTADWQFTINDARIKLKNLYPKSND